MQIFYQEISDFLKENNNDILTTFDEWKTSVSNTYLGSNPQPVVNKHKNTAHNNNGGHNNHANGHSNGTPHSNSHSNSETHSNSHSNANNHGNSNSHRNDANNPALGGSHGNGWDIHANSGGHSNSHTNGPQHSNSHTNGPQHSNGHSNNGGHNNHINQAIPHVNTGFNHTNHIPGSPNFYDLNATTYKNTISLVAFSPDKDNDNVYYTFQIRKVGTSNWITVQGDASFSNNTAVASTLNTYVWNSKNPLVAGMDMNGDFEIKVSTYNILNTAKVNGIAPATSNIVSSSKIIKLKQNESPTIAVQNGGSFINFTFGEKVYTNTETKDYSAIYSQNNLVVNATIVDVDKDNYIKAWCNVYDETNAVLDVIPMSFPDGNIVSANNATAKTTATAVISKEKLKQYANNKVKNISIKITAQDYLDNGGVNACDAIVTQPYFGSQQMKFNIDFIAPILSISKPTTWIGTNAYNCVINAQDNILDYVLTPSGTKVQNGANYPIYKNGSYVFTAVDKAGNKTQQTIVVDKFDKDAPQLDLTMKIYPRADMSAWEKDIVMVLNTQDIASGVQAVKVNGVNVASSNYEFKIASNVTTTIEVLDNANNKAKTILHFYNSASGEKPYVADKAAEAAGVDQYAPEHHISIDIGNTRHMGDWLKSIPFSVSSIDYNGKVTSFKFGGAVQSGAATVAKATLDNKYLAESEDGNYYSSKTSLTFVNMDKIAPTLAITGYQDSVYSQEVKLNFNKTDTGDKPSGADYVLITLPSGNKVKSYLDSYDVVENGTYKFELYDYAGNKSAAQTYTFTKIDRIKPIVNPVQINKTGWVAKAEITFTTSDNLSGVSQVFVRKAGETTKYPFAPNAKFTTKENGTYYVSAVDCAGNESTEVAIVVSNVDMIAPTVTVEYVSPATNQYVDSVDIKITGNDTESGIKSIHLPTGQVIFASSYVHTVTENGTYSYYVTDNAGNVSEVNSIPVTNIDTSGVTVTHTKTYNPDTQKVTINFVMTDEESGVVRLVTPTETINLNGNKTENCSVEVSENGTYTYQIINGINKITNYRVTVNECPGAGIDTFQIISASDETGTGSMLADGSALPSVSAGVYKNGYVTLQAISVNSPDDVIFSLSGGSNSYVLDAVKSERGSNNNEWNFHFKIADTSVTEAVVEIQAQAVTGNVYSKPKSVLIKITRTADGQPVANIIG